jgi:hypothetical protein
VNLGWENMATSAVYALKYVYSLGTSATGTTTCAIRCSFVSVVADMCE